MWQTPYRFLCFACSRYCGGAAVTLCCYYFASFLKSFLILMRLFFTSLPIAFLSSVINPTQYQPERFGVQIASANLVFIYPLKRLLFAFKLHYFGLIPQSVLCADRIAVMSVKQHISLAGFPNHQRISTAVLKNVFLKLRKFALRERRYS